MRKKRTFSEKWVAPTNFVLLFIILSLFSSITPQNIYGKSWCPKNQYANTWSKPRPPQVVRYGGYNPWHKKGNFWRNTEQARYWWGHRANSSINAYLRIDDQGYWNNVRILDAAVTYYRYHHSRYQVIIRLRIYRGWLQFIWANHWRRTGSTWDTWMWFDISYPRYWWEAARRWGYTGRHRFHYGRSHAWHSLYYMHMDVWRRRWFHINIMFTTGHWWLPSIAYPWGGKYHWCATKAFLRVNSDSPMAIGCTGWTHLTKWHLRVLWGWRWHTWWYHGYNWCWHWYCSWGHYWWWWGWRHYCYRHWLWSCRFGHTHRYWAWYWNWGWRVGIYTHHCWNWSWTHWHHVYWTIVGWWRWRWDYHTKLHNLIQWRWGHYYNYEYARDFYFSWGGTHQRFNGLVYGTQGTSYYQSHYHRDFRNEIGYQGKIPYHLASPEAGIYKNFWGKTGANVFQTYQDKNFDDNNLGNRFLGHQNGILLKKSSRLWNMSPMKFTINGDITIRQSSTFKSPHTFNHYNRYGIRGYRQRGWQIQNLFRMFNYGFKHQGAVISVDQWVYMYGYRSWYCFDRKMFGWISWGVRPRYWNCFHYSWNSDGYPGQDWNRAQTYSFTYITQMWSYQWHYHNMLYSELRDSHYAYVANGYWSIYLHGRDPMFEFHETIEGLENKYNPYQISPRLIRSGWTHAHWVGHCDQAPTWQRSASVWEPPSSCHMWYYHGGKKIYMDFFKHKAGWVGNRKGEKFAGCFVKQRMWHDNLLRRTNQGFGDQKSCKDVNFIFSPRHKRCIKLSNCEQRNEERTGCVKCTQGHELQAITKTRKGNKHKPMSYFRQNKMLRKWAQKVKQGMSQTKCVPCGKKQVYSHFTGSCNRSLKAKGLLYYIPPNTDFGNHYIYNIIRPKAPRARANSVTFDINIKTNGKISNGVHNRLTVETKLYYLNSNESCRTPECYYRKRSFRPILDGKCSFYDKGWGGVMQTIQGRGCPQGTWNHKRVFSDLRPSFKDKKGKKYYRLMFTHSLKDFRPNYLLKIQFFRRDNKYREFFVDKFNFRFDAKALRTKQHLYQRADYTRNYFHLKGKYWDWNSQNNIPAEEGKKTPFMGEPRNVPVRKVNFKGKYAEEDFPWYQARVKRGKPIPKSLNKLAIRFDYSFNAVQSWVKVHKRHKRSSNLPLFASQIKASSDGKYKNLAVYANMKQGRMFMRYNGKKYGLTSKKYKLDWTKWQFVGLGIMYRMKGGRFEHCVVLFTTMTKNDAEIEKNKPALCLQAPAFYGNLVTSWGTDNVSKRASRVFATYYGNTIAYQLLHNDYYNERNIFLNFEQNTLAPKLQVKNFARKNSNNATLMTYGEKEGIIPYMFRDSRTPQPFWAIWSQPRSKGFQGMGPLEDSYYVTGYLTFEDNSENYKGFGGEEKWEAYVPIYRLVDRNGKDLIKLDHHVSYDPSKRFIQRSKFKPGDINRYNSDKIETYRRITSRIHTYTRIYDPKRGRVPSDMNYEAMYPSYKLQLADFKQKKTKFMFNVFYRPLKNYYFKGKKFNRDAALLGIRHSWGCFKYMPMYKNKEYSHKHNKHFLADLNIANGLQYNPVKHHWISFAHTNGPVKMCTVKWDEEHIGVGLESKVYNTVYRSTNFDRMDLYGDPHATIKSQQQFWEQGTQGDNMSSSFSNGLSFACAHGFMLTLHGKKITCSRPPLEKDNVYEESILWEDFMKTPKRYDYNYFKKINGKQTKFWSPFYHHYYNKYGIYDYYSSADLYYKNKRDHPGCYISDTKAVKNVWHQMNNKKKYLSWTTKPKCVACKKGWYMQNFKNLKWKFEGGWVCKKCNIPQCEICKPGACMSCKEGYELVNKRCRACGRADVWDPVTKRCFGQKMNNYIDINYNMEYSDIIVGDIFGIDKDTTGIINFDLDYAKQNEFGEPIKVNPAIFNITAMDGEKEFSYIYNNVPLVNRRKFHISTPFPAGKQLKLKMNIGTLDVSDFQHFALRNFRYSLQKAQKGKKLDLYFKDDKKANAKVDASYLAHKPTIPEREVFENYKSFKLGTAVPEEFLYSEFNERDEMNGNWVQTWFKIGVKPDFQDTTTMINIHGWKECPADGGCEFQHKVVYDYRDSRLWYVDEEGARGEIWRLKKFDTMNKWLFVCLLMRKQGSGHSQQFEVLVANTFDDIENQLVSKEGEELGGEKFQYHPGLRRELSLRKLSFTQSSPGLGFTPKQLEDDKSEQEKSNATIKAAEQKSTRKLGDDDWDKSQEEPEEEETVDPGLAKQVAKPTNKLVRRKKKTRAFKSAKTNPRIIFKREGSFMQQDSTLDVSFALGDFKSKTADFVGSLYGSNYYKWYTFPMSRVYNFYMMEDNPYKQFGRVKNWADSTDKTAALMVYKEESGYYYPFHDDFTYFGGDTFMESKLNKAADNPNIANTLITGVFEVKDNLDDWRMTHGLATNFTKPLFVQTMANGTEVLRIDHYIQIPKYSEEKKDEYFTSSKLLIKALRGFNKKGKEMYTNFETKVFNLAKQVNKTLTYTFQFWTDLTKKYFLKQKRPLMDMIVHFRDNQETEFDVKAFNSIWIDRNDYTHYSSHTLENYGVEPPLYNHKLVTLYVAQASHQYEKDFAKDPLAKFESKLTDSALMCYAGYVPVFDKKFFVKEKELADERAVRREERKKGKAKRKAQKKAKQLAKEKAKELERKSREAERASEQEAMDAQKEAKDAAAALLKKLEDDAKKKEEEKKNPKKADAKKDDKKDAKKDRRLAVAKSIKQKITKLVKSKSRTLGDAKPAAAAAAEKPEKKKPVMLTLEKLDKQKPRCAKLPPKFDECYRDDSNRCLACRKGFVPMEFKCQKCATSCLSCDLENKCTECENGFFLHKLGPRDIVCVECDPLQQIFDATNKKCIPFKDMDYKEKLKPFSDSQFKQFTIPEIQVPDQKNLFMYVQFYFRWEISPYKFLLNIKSTDDQGQQVPVQKYIGVDSWEPKKSGQKKYKTVVRFRVPARKGRKVKMSIAPTIEKKEDFTFLFIEDYKFSWQFYNEDPFVLMETNTELNVKDLPPPAPKVVEGKKGKDGKRLAAEGKDLKADDKNLYKKIAEEDVLSERITQLGSLSLGDLKDVITKLTMVKALPEESQIALRALKLNLDPAMRRCENIHGPNNCTTAWGTIAVKKCVGGYIRSGCCRCSLPCPGEGFVDKGPSCYKARPYQTNSYSDLQDCESKNE